MEQNTILIILTAVFLLFTVVSLPFLLQIWRAARNISETLRLLNESLPTIMKNLEEITTNVNRTTTTIRHQVEELSLDLKKVQGVMSILFTLEEILRSRIRLPIAGTLRTSAAVIKGMQVFLKLLLRKAPKERKPE